MWIWLSHRPGGDHNLIITLGLGYLWPRIQGADLIWSICINLAQTSEGTANWERGVRKATESCCVRQKGQTSERREIVKTGLISSSRVREEKPQLGKINNSEGKKRPGFGGQKTSCMEELLLGPVEVSCSPSDCCLPGQQRLLIGGWAH